MKYRCEFGHLDDQGRPIVHASRARCDRAVRADRDRKLPPSTSPPPGAPAGPAPGPTPAPTPGAEPAPKPTGAGVSVTYREATTTNPKDPKAPQPAADTEWVVTNETAIRFVEICVGALRAVVNFACRFFQIPLMHESVWEIDPGQQYVIKTTLKVPITKFLKGMGAKSPEEADKLVGRLGGLMAFGILGGRILMHFWTHLPNSPRIKKMREQKALRDAKKKQEQLETARREALAAGPGAPGPKPGIVPVVGGG